MPLVCGTTLQHSGTPVVYVRDPIKIFKHELVAALEYSFSSWPLSVNRVEVKSIKLMQKLLWKWTYPTNGSLKKYESRCTLIILASIIFSLFQTKPSRTGERGLLPFPILPHHPSLSCLTPGQIWGPNRNKGPTNEQEENGASFLLFKCWHKSLPREAEIGQDAEFSLAGTFLSFILIVCLSQLSLSCD